MSEDSDPEAAQRQAVAHWRAQYDDGATDEQRRALRAEIGFLRSALGRIVNLDEGHSPDTALAANVARMALAYKPEDKG